MRKLAATATLVMWLGCGGVRAVSYNQTETAPGSSAGCDSCGGTGSPVSLAVVAATLVGVSVVIRSLTH
jgi:hypothetical protein